MFCPSLRTRAALRRAVRAISDTLQNIAVPPDTWTSCPNWKRGRAGERPPIPRCTRVRLTDATGVEDMRPASFLPDPLSRLYLSHRRERGSTEFIWAYIPRSPVASVWRTRAAKSRAVKGLGPGSLWPVAGVQGQVIEKESRGKLPHSPFTRYFLRRKRCFLCRTARRR